jgi:hypothetical protein
VALSPLTQMVCGRLNTVKPHKLVVISVQLVSIVRAQPRRPAPALPVSSCLTKVLMHRQSVFRAPKVNIVVLLP